MTKIYTNSDSFGSISFRFFVNNGSITKTVINCSIIPEKKSGTKACLKCHYQSFCQSIKELAQSYKRGEK